MQEYPDIDVTLECFSHERMNTVHESHPFFRIPELTPELLENERILITIVGTKGHQAFLDSLCANYPIKQKQFLTTSSMDELITLLTSGFSIAVLSEQERFSFGVYRQFPLKKISASIVGAWHYTNPARNLLLQHLLRQLTPPKTT